MAKVLTEMSMSLDGYVAGPDVTAESPMGRGGERLHEWMFASRSAAESERFETDHFTDIGALIIGRRMADLGIRPWGEEPTFHAPCFVVTHRPAETIEKRGGTSYVFVTGGIDEALSRAQDAAGSQDVLINGGADIVRQSIAPTRDDHRNPPPAARAAEQPAFAQGVSIDGSARMVYVGGQNGVGADGTIAGTDAGSQTRQALSLLSSPNSRRLRQRFILSLHGRPGSWFSAAPRGRRCGSSPLRRG